MTVTVVVAVVLLLVGLYGSFSARRQVSWLKRQPDPYGMEVLAKDPDGVEEFVRCPDGTQLRVVSKGTGPTVVFAHGLSASLVEWNVIWSRLSEEGYRLIAFDLRGHGKSTVGSGGMGSAAMAGDFATILEHFDVREGILVGHSLGGFLSMVLMTQNLDLVKARLRSAVLVATFAGVILQGPQDWNPDTLTGSELPPRRRWKENIGYAFAWSLARSGILPYLARTQTCYALTRSLMGERPFFSAVDLALALMSAHDLRRSLPIVRASFFEDLYPKLKTIPVPCIAVCGDADKAAGPHHTERIARGIPNARALYVEGSGHLITLEAPEAIIEVIGSLGAPKVRLEERLERVGVLGQHARREGAEPRG